MLFITNKKKPKTMKNSGGGVVSWEMALNFIGRCLTNYKIMAMRRNKVAMRHNNVAMGRNKFAMRHNLLSFFTTVVQLGLIYS